MKKLLLSSLLLAGALIPMSAQDFYLLYEDQPVENGDVINYTEFESNTIYAENQETGEQIPFGISWILDPDLYLFTETAGSYTVEVVSNITNLKLCMLLDANDPATGQCLTGFKELTKTPVVMGANDSRSLQLDYDESTTPYIPGQTYDFPEINATINVWNLENPDEVYSVTLNMGGFQAAGVESLIDGSSSVSFSNNVLNYDLPSASNLTVYSLSGRVVLEKQVSGNGSLNLANLPKGIYLYRVSGKVAKAAKIIIK